MRGRLFIFKSGVGCFYKSADVIALKGAAKTLLNLFGSSGVRGLVNVELSPILAVKLGLAIGTLTRGGRVFLARDTRVSGEMLEKALVSGLLACGADVRNFGVRPTPVLAYLTKKLEADAGIVITASHNPPQYNGIKIFDREGLAYNEEKQKKIEDIIKEEGYSFAKWHDIGEVSNENDDSSYSEMIERNIQLERKWHIVVDTGCGATSHLAPLIFKRLGCRTTTMNAQFDGFFPGRSPEPDANSLQPLARVVRELHADLGVAYDGDGDRVAFIDETGAFIEFDRILAAYTAHVLNKKGGGKVVTTIEASMCVDKMAEKYNGKVIRTKVGDVYVAEALRRLGAVFGGEPCGAWIHPEFHYCPDGVLSSVLLLKALEHEDKVLSKFVADVPAYPMIRKSIQCGNEAKVKAVERVKELLFEVSPAYKQLSDIDGVRLDMENGWILIRASGTEPLLRVTVEGESLKFAEEIMNKTLSIVKKAVRDVKG
ncbi:MAG: phosphoglucosamine mutase [Candidatus Bathyarchaeota archaeon]|nr:phosphoglucosamine mutase [Candidatus Bathyarchaeota archaeon]